MAGPLAGEKPESAEKLLIGITIGDPAGIGPEICLKALDRKIPDLIPVVYSDRIVLEDAVKITGKKFLLNSITEPKEAAGQPGTIDFIETGSIAAPGDYSIGTISKKSGDASFRYVEKAIRDALEKKISAVVTCPISKEAVNLAGHHFAGHTEIFAHYTNTRNYGMLLSAKAGNSGRRLNIIHATTHVSLREACDLVSRERVLNAILLAQKALVLMGSKTKRIAVAGLNPHSSENGLFGTEENESIIPAVTEARGMGLDVSGPLPPDTVFVKALGGLFDITVAMYHDQGHIPLKLCGFSVNTDAGGFADVSGINTTIGLPVIRTSVDHGTAFDIAGKNLASDESLVDAIETAVTFVRNS